MIARIYTLDNFRFVGVAKDKETLARKLMTAALLANAVEIHGKDNNGNRVDGIWLSRESKHILDMFN